MPIIPRRLRAIARRIFQRRRARSLSLSSRDGSYYTPSIVEAEPDHPSAGITPYPYTQPALVYYQTLNTSRPWKHTPTQYQILLHPYPSIYRTYYPYLLHTWQKKEKLPLR